MSDPKEAADALASTAASAALNPALTPGRQLLAAREARKLSLDDVAQHLKYSPRQIEALEFDDYAALPGATVVRGMIRSYARFLNLEAEPLLEQVRGRTSSPHPSVAVEKMDVPFPTRAAGGHRLWWVLSGIVALGVAVFVLDWALNARERLAAAIQAGTPAQSTPAPAASTPETPGIAPTTEPPAEMPAQPGGLAAPVATIGGAAPATPASVAPAAPVTPATPSTPAAPAPVATPAVTPAPPAPAVAAGPTKRLVMRFARDSWVEVRDADGQSLMNRMNAGGTEATVDGKAPLRVVIGAASGVTATFDGRPVDVAAATQVDVARLNLE